MSRFISASVTFGLLGLAWTALAMPPPSPSAQPIRPWESGQGTVRRGIGEISGRAVVRSGGRLLVSPAGQDSAALIFLVRRTRVQSAGGQVLPHTALKSGDRVRIDYDLTGNTLIARRVTVLAPADARPRR